MNLLKDSDLANAKPAFRVHLQNDYKLKDKCDRQIAHFNALGIANDEGLCAGERSGGKESRGA